MDVDIPIVPAASFLQDDWAIKCQAVSPQDFLFSGKVPAVGQLTESQVFDAQGNYWHLSGVVSQVNPFEEWIAQMSGNDRQMREYWGNYDAQIYGTASIVGYSVVSSTFTNLEAEPCFRKGKVYRIEYRADEKRQYLYTIQRVTEIPDECLSLLSPIVLDFLTSKTADNLFPDFVKS